jgi:hypothetical protein
MVLFPILFFVSLENEEIGLPDQLTVLTSQHSNGSRHPINCPVVSHDSGRGVSERFSASSYRQHAAPKARCRWAKHANNQFYQV